MANEKQEYGLNETQSPTISHNLSDVVQNKGGAIGEAADLYGNVQVAEDLGYVHRGLKSRHIQFIALGMLS